LSVAPLGGNKDGVEKITAAGGRAGNKADVFRFKNDGFKSTEVFGTGFDNSINEKFAGDGGFVGIVDQLSFDLDRLSIFNKLTSNGSIDRMPVDELREGRTAETFSGRKEINGFENIGFAGTIGANDEVNFGIKIERKFGV